MNEVQVLDPSAQTIGGIPEVKLHVMGCREMEELLKVFDIAATLKSLLSQGQHCPPEIIEAARAELIWRSNALIRFHENEI